jgi:hypothetical protein
MNHCWECGTKNVPFHKHHPVPRIRGGKRTIRLCEECHSKAHHRNKRMNTSTLTSEALQRKIAAGWKAGNSRITEYGISGRAKIMREADDYALSVQSIFLHMHNELCLVTNTAKAKYLNEQGVETRRDSIWTPSGVTRIIERLECLVNGIELRSPRTQARTHAKKGEKNEEQR